MCTSAILPKPKVPALPPPPVIQKAAPPPQVRETVAKTAEKVEDAERDDKELLAKKKKGTGSLRIDLGANLGGGGTGLNIPS